MKRASYILGYYEIQKFYSICGPFCAINFYYLSSEFFHTFKHRFDSIVVFE